VEALLGVEVNAPTALPVGTLSDQDWGRIQAAHLLASPGTKPISRRMGCCPTVIVGAVGSGGGGGDGRADVPGLRLAGCRASLG
jgi:hypothetical protein